ncbi:tyrosine protein kinase [Bacteroidia bacterium]|nr:tyrosine protein kinase [Bacteroidia bacterium]GHV08947.1 tyrosine protein kinase [Bacteroidia bacterium]
MENNQDKENLKGNRKEVDFQWFLVTVLVYWKWFLFSILMFFSLGYVYLRYSTPIYNIETKILLKDSSRGRSNSEISVFENMGYLGASNLENEIEVLRSRNLIEEVVKRGGFFIRYMVKGKIKATELYGDNNPIVYSTSPIQVFADSMTIASLHSSIVLNVSLTDEEMVLVEGTYWGVPFSSKFTTFPAVLETPVGELLLTSSEKTKLLKEFPLEISLIPTLGMAQFYQSMLTMIPQEKTANVKVSISEVHTRRGEDFLQLLIDTYNEESMNEKNRSARTASNFIATRLEALEKDLKAQEEKIKEFKQENHITTELELEAQLALDKEDEYIRKAVDWRTENILLDYLEDELLNKSDLKLLPSSLGTLSPQLRNAIDDYNDLVNERTRLSQYVGTGFSRYDKLEERINNKKDDIKDGIASLRDVFSKKEGGDQNLSTRYEGIVQDMPRREIQLAQLLRLQTIQTQLYTSFSERKNDIDIMKEVTTSNAQVLEYPLASGAPISPRRMLTYLICLSIGVILPFVIVGIIDLLNYKISNRSEIARYTDTPILVSLPNVKSIKSPLVVTPSATSSIVECFRLLRTNIQFALEGAENSHSVLVTSAISGDGKTFVSINLAQTFALKYRTVLVGMDIRRPKINTYLNLPKGHGLISFLTEEESDLDNLIIKNANGSNLDVLVSGIVPPNPNELLTERKLDDLFFELRKRYDYIIIDSSPVGQVSDAFLLNRVSDMTLFVIRCDLTPKSAISLINYIHQENRLNNLNIVMNGFSEDYSGYGYGGYGGRYGYGYGDFRSGRYDYESEDS